MSTDKLSSRFHITKYPTLKLIRNGHPAKKEYRGQRSAESFLKFLEEEIRDPVKVINSTDELQEVSSAVSGTASVNYLPGGGVLYVQTLHCCSRSR